MIHMMGRENVRPCGQSSKLHTRKVAMSLIFIIVGRKFLQNCMNFAWIKGMLIVTSLQNGKRQER